MISWKLNALNLLKKEETKKKRDVYDKKKQERSLKRCYINQFFHYCQAVANKLHSRLVARETVGVLTKKVCEELESIGFIRDSVERLISTVVVPEIVSTSVAMIVEPTAYSKKIVEQAVEECMKNTADWRASAKKM
jgi:hypothetical protein